MPSFLDLALAHASDGWAVFPCQPGKKIPFRGTRGFKDATTDPAQIRSWWAACPDANIGIAIPDGIVAIDIDPRNNGYANFSAIVPNSGEIQTRSHLTRSDGMHLFFVVPLGVTFPAQLCAGVDIKQFGGYVIAPGSVVDGSDYRVIDRLDIAVAPQWLQSRMRRRGEPDSARARDIDLSDRKLSDSQCAEIAANFAAHVVPGSRHALAKALGGWFRQRGFGAGDVAQILWQMPFSDPSARAQAALATFALNGVNGYRALLDLTRLSPEQLEEYAPNPAQEATDRAIEMLAGCKMFAPQNDIAAAKPIVRERARARAERRLAAGARIATGIPKLDDLCRGGVRVGTLVVVGGAPGAGKTSLCAQAASHLARSGCGVVWGAWDESAEGIDARRLQAIGVPRSVAEGESTTLDFAALDRIDAEDFDCVESATVEQLFAAAAEWYPDQTRVIVIDSLQKARTARSSALEPRARVDDAIDTIKRLADAPATKAIVLCTSELARAAYRKTDDSVEDIAAFKESGGIEYAGQVLLLMRSAPGDGDLVDISVPKCRLGDKGAFTLRRDRETTLFSDVEGDANAAEIAKVQSLDSSATRIAARVLSAVAWGCANTHEAGGLTQSSICTRSQTHRAACIRALELLESAGVVRATVGSRGSVRYAITSAIYLPDVPPDLPNETALNFAKLSAWASARAQRPSPIPPPAGLGPVLVAAEIDAREDDFPSARC